MNFRWRIWFFFVSVSGVLMCMLVTKCTKFIQIRLLAWWESRARIHQQLSFILMLHAFHSFDGRCFFPSHRIDSALLLIRPFFHRVQHISIHSLILSVNSCVFFRPKSTKSHQIKIMAKIWVKVRGNILSRYHLNDFGYSCFDVVQFSLSMAFIILRKFWYGHKIHGEIVKFGEKKILFIWINALTNEFSFFGEKHIICKEKYAHSWSGKKCDWRAKLCGLEAKMKSI